MIKIGICDDEQSCKDILYRHCQDISKDLATEFTYQLFSSGEEVLTTEETIDLLLLDIEMSGKDGIETMRKLENYDNIKNILFVSGNSQRVFDSFGSKTRGFLCKPVDYVKLVDEIKKIIHSQRNGELIEIVESSGITYVNSLDIIIIEVVGKTLKIYTKDREYNINDRLVNWSLKLEKYDIVQVHKSFLVNLEYVMNIKDLVVLDGIDMEVPVGRKYKEICRQKYKEYTFKRLRERANGR